MDSSAGEVYPVLPLRDIVVFPHMIVPLFVGREKSVRALEDVMKDDKVTIAEFVVISACEAETFISLVFRLFDHDGEGENVTHDFLGQLKLEGDAIYEEIHSRK